MKQSTLRQRFYLGASRADARVRITERHSPHQPRVRSWLTAGLGLALLLSSLGGCAEEESTPTPTSPTPEPTPTWAPPIFTGDGLPPSEDLNHSTGDTSNDAPDRGDDDPDEEPSTLTIVNGLFTYSHSEESGEWLASLVLMSITAGCDDLFGSVGKISPDGLYFTVYPDRSGEAGAFPAWVNAYGLCGESPCVSGYALVAGEMGELEDTAWLDITRYDPHYLTVNWSTSYSSGSELTFYNCGDVSIWSE